MKKITVEIEQLDSCAARMEEKNQEYLHNCNAMFEAIETMSKAWIGEDNTAFTSKIMSYESDFHQLHVLGNEYIDFLRNSAKSYRNTQQELTTMVNSFGK